MQERMILCEKHGVASYRLDLQVLVLTDLFKRIFWEPK